MGLDSAGPRSAHWDPFGVNGPGGILALALPQGRECVCVCVCVCESVYVCVCVCVDCEEFHASLTSCSADVDVSESDHISMCGSGDETDCPPMATRAPWLAHDPPRQRMKFGDG